MKTHKGKLLLVSALLVASLVLSACGAQYFNIPSGYVGCTLTPNGWGDCREAGQVNLGDQNWDGSGNSLVLLEVTTVSVKEQFLQEGGGGGDVVDTADHRILTADGVPATVDVYVRLIVPADEQARIGILAQVTPEDAGVARVSKITVQNIYNRFAQQDVRGAVRALFFEYADIEAVYADYGNIPEELGKRIQEIFTRNGVPLVLQSVSLSNVKPDSVVYEASNELSAAETQAEAISIISDALRDNPEYLEYLQWQKLLEIALSGTNVTIIVDGADGGLSPSYLVGQDGQTPQGVNSETQVEGEEGN